MMNSDLTIEKVMEFLGLKNEKDLAKALGISPQDFSNRKKRGTLLPVILDWAIHENVNLEWLFRHKKAEAVEEPLLTYRHRSPVVEKIDQMLKEMGEEAQRDVLKYTEEKKLLAELMSERQGKKAG